MIATGKLAPGQPFPSIRLPKAGGGTIDPAADAGWRMLVVYRGSHCPLSKRYLNQLNSLLPDFRDEGITVYAVSADSKGKAEADISEQGWQFPVGYELVPDQMGALGLYVSNPRSPEETDRPFPEPGVFVINPDGDVHVVSIANAPFAGPSLTDLLDGLRFIKANDFPIRGTA